MALLLLADCCREGTSAVGSSPRFAGLLCRLQQVVVLSLHSTLPANKQTNQRASCQLSWWSSPASASARPGPACFVSLRDTSLAKSTHVSAPNGGALATHATSISCHSIGYVCPSVRLCVCLSVSLFVFRSSFASQILSLTCFKTSQRHICLSLKIFCLCHNISLSIGEATNT